VVLTVWLNVSVVGDTPITGVSATPVPDKLVLLWPPAALWVTTRLAVREPAAEGVKPTLMVQLLLAGTEPASDTQRRVAGADAVGTAEREFRRRTRR
jgi:hypothetical protein